MIMKTNNIFKSIMLLAAAMFSIVSCEETIEPGSETVEPEFPELVKDSNVEAGSFITLTFSANMDYVVSVPKDNLLWFWIQDGAFEVDRLSGKVEPGQKVKVTVRIGVSDIEEFDVNRSCKVTLTMGGRSEVIAEYMRPAKERVLNVYAARCENGEFVKDQSGNYEYIISDEATAVELIWSAEDADFRMPLKVDSNIDWTIMLPDWAEVIGMPESATGVHEIVLTGASLSEVSGNVAFMQDDVLLKELEVSVSSCAEVAVFSAEFDEVGGFVYDEAGESVYTDESVDALSLVWPGTDYRMPVRIDSKCDWSIELPEWLTVRYDGDEPENKRGTVYLTFVGNPLYYPMEDTTEDVVFSYEGQRVHKVSVTIPGSGDRFSYGIDMSLTSWEFNADAELLTTLGYQDIPATAWFSGTKNASVVVVETADGKMVRENPSWLKTDVQAYVSGADVLQHRTVTVRPELNDGPERSALVLFCMDTYQAEDWFGADGSLKEDMGAYAVSLVQYGSDLEYVTMLSSEDDMAWAGAMFAKSENPRLYVDSKFGATDYAYELTYTNEYASDEAMMSFSKAYDSYKVFNAAKTDKTSDEKFWLSFVGSEDKKSGTVKMDYDTQIEGYLVFYDAEGNTLAVIKCTYDPEVEIGPKITAEFTVQSAADAAEKGYTLEHLTQGELFDMYNDGHTPLYHLRYTSEGSPMKVILSSMIKTHTVSPEVLKSCFLVNGKVFDSYFGATDNLLGEVEPDAEGAVEIHMSIPDNISELIQAYPNELSQCTSTMIRGVMNFTKANGDIVLILLCTLDLSE